MDDVTAASSTPRAVVWLLLALLVSSAVPRVWLITVQPDTSRLWDERFTVANVAIILQRGAFDPQNYWYGSLSYLPQLALVAAWEGAREELGGIGPAPRTPNGRGFTPAGYVAGRAIQAIYGLLSLVLTYLLGHRIFSPWVGLAGAFFLAASPRHLHSSSVLKPDILLALLTVAAFLGFVAAIRRLRLAPYLVSGLAVGLATATKLNGGALGLPLALGTALRARSGYRRWLYLVAAGATSLATYALLNPQLARIWDAFEKNRSWYDQHAAASRSGALADMAGYLFDPAFHGPVVAALAVAGAVLLARRAVAAGLTSVEGAVAATFLSFPLLYVAVYLLVTTRAKENHFLQILPFSALLAGLAVEAAWRWVARRWPGAGVRRALVASAAAGVALVAWPAMAFAYAVAVPRTEALALRWVEAGMTPPAAARTVIYDLGLERVPEMSRLRTAFVRPPEPARLGAAALAGADALVLRGDRLAEPGADDLLRHLARVPPDKVTRIAPGALAARGPALVAAIRPFSLVGTPLTKRLRSLPGTGALRATFPAVPPGATWTSYQVVVPSPAPAVEGWALAVRGEPIPVTPARAPADAAAALSGRIPANPRPRTVVELEIPGLRSAAGVTVTRFAWALPEESTRALPEELR